MFETAMFCELMEKAQKKAHANSRNKGFWDGEENNIIPTKLCLIHSEVSEWLEAFRKGNPPCDKDIRIIDPNCRTPDDPIGSRRITSEEEEAADTFIRLLDLCEKQRIDLARVTLAKMFYNEQRPFRHGGKKMWSPKCSDPEHLSPNMLVVLEPMKWMCPKCGMETILRPNNYKCSGRVEKEGKSYFPGDPEFSASFPPCDECGGRGYTGDPDNGWKSTMKRCSRGCPVQCSICRDPNCGNPGGQH